VCDQREGVHATEQIPCRKREHIVIGRRWTRDAADNLASLTRHEALDFCRIDRALERVGELAGEVLAFADARVVERLALFQRLFAHCVDMRAADDYRNLWPILLDPLSDLHGTRVLNRHTRDAHEIRFAVPRTRDDLVDGELGELAIEHLDLVPGRPQRARDVGDAEPGKPRPVPVEFATRRRLNECDLHRATVQKPRRSRIGNSTDEKPAPRNSASTSVSV
jgi:hypothetical protein